MNMSKYDENMARKFNSIQEMLMDWLSSNEHRQVCACGIFTSGELLTWHNILRGTPGGNFIIFFNGGGKPFEIWRDPEGKFIEALLKDDKGYIFAYKLNGVETILQNLPKY